MSITVYDVGGTSRLFGVGVPSPGVSTWLQDGLAAGFTYQWVDYSAEALPMNTSVNTGVANLTTAINATSPGDKFVLVGTSQGAMVTSNVYVQLRSGKLAQRNNDLLGAVTFGNPMRQAGHTFPRCPDPGGHGCFGTRLTNTEQRWWDFANPKDPACTVGDDNTGRWMTILFDAANEDYNGTAGSLARIIAAHPMVLFDAPAAVHAICNYLVGAVLPGGAHGTYNVTTPIPGDPRTCFEIALDYINSLAAGRPRVANAVLTP